MSKFLYKTSGVCSRSIEIDIEDEKIISVKFDGGCNGNTQGISSLVIGMNVNEVISRLKNIKCGFKSTSCPDQLAKALEKYIQKKSDANV